MMVASATPPANGFVRVMRKVYNPVGFSKGYNFILWFIFAGALFGFGLARLQYLDIPGVFCKPGAGSNGAAPGECYYYNNFNRDKIGIRLHLYCIIPAALLVVFQFVPAIRYKAILAHRLNGYLVILLASVANAGALMIGHVAFGGTMATQALVGVLVIITTLGFILAIINIKRLQIDQHRAWMLRTWFYFGTIITLRIILISAASIISSYGNRWLAMPCGKIVDILGSSDTANNLFPACQAYTSGVDLSAHAPVLANMNGNGVEVAAALNLCFGMAGWIALFLHAVGVEIYLHLTPRESQRLRDVSYQRQLEAGYKNPGNAGLTPQRLGDARPFMTLEQQTAKLGNSTSSLQKKAVDNDSRSISSGSGSH